MAPPPGAADANADRLAALQLRPRQGPSRWVIPNATWCAALARRRTSTSQTMPAAIASPSSPIRAASVPASTPSPPDACRRSSVDPSRWRSLRLRGPLEEKAGGDVRALVVLSSAVGWAKRSVPTTQRHVCVRMVGTAQGAFANPTVFHANRCNVACKNALARRFVVLRTCFQPVLFGAL